MRGWRRRLTGVGVAVAALLTLTAEDLQLTERELECEQAVSHLASCCPNFHTAAIHCDQGACNPTPDLTVAESQCLDALDCAEVVARGMCALDTRFPSASGDPPAVSCP